MIPFDWYYALHGTNLFPCHKRVLNDPRSKTPLESGFYNRKYSRMSLEAYQDEGHGVGCSLGKRYFVMDVDAPTDQRPDKQGLESLERLIADTGLDLEFVPCVESPSGGRHYYFKKPPQMKIRKVLKEYQGIEFITGNNYGLIAGSPHWQGDHYAFSADTQLLGLTPDDAPVGLLDKLEKITKPNEASQMSCEHLELLLEHVDQDLHSTYDDWLQIAMASHSATGGAGLAEFTSWSAGGAKFTSECRIKEQWDSFDANEEGGITVGTLLHIIKEDMDLMTAEDAEKAAFDLARVKASLAFSDADWGDEWDIDSEDGCAPAETAGKTETKKPKKPDKPEWVDVYLDDTEIKLNARKVVRHLHKLPGLYKKGSRLVSVFERKPLDNESSDAHYLEILPVEDVELKYDLSELVRFFKRITNKEGLPETVQCRIPGDLPAYIIKSKGWPTVPEITGISTSPVLLSDGSIVQEPGLHRGSGIYFHPMGAFPGVPDEVSKDEAKAAAERLLDIVCDFPFRGPAHKSAWLSVVLTLVGRPAIDGPAPLFIVDGNQPATGKSLLVSCATLISSGKPSNARARPKSDEEMRKQITSSLKTGEQVACWDNLDNGGSFGFPCLDALLTTRVWSDRLLGGNDVGTFINNMVLLGTANKFKVQSDVDTSRRLVFIGIDSGFDDPSKRTTFKHGAGDQLTNFVLQNRPQFVVDALSILRAYLQSGETIKLSPFASYDAWSRLIRAAIVWIGLPDPCEALKDAAEAIDAEGDAAELVLSAMEEAQEYLAAERNGLAPQEVTSKDILLAAEDCNPDKYPQLRRAYEDIFCVDKLGRRIVPSAIHVGRTVNGFSRKPVAGRRIESRTSCGLMWFRIERTPAGAVG